MIEMKLKEASLYSGVHQKTHQRLDREDKLKPIRSKTNRRVYSIEDAENSENKLIKIYENVFHRLQLYGEVTLNGDKLSKLLKKIYDWSYAHRQGNGELSDEEQQELINSCLRKLEETEHD
jgi:DNA-binding transcriptional MerR regulator